MDLFVTVVPPKNRFDVFCADDDDAGLKKTNFGLASEQAVKLISV